MSDNEPISFEKTKSTVVDFIVYLRRSRTVTIITTGVNAILVLFALLVYFPVEGTPASFWPAEQSLKWLVGTIVVFTVITLLFNSKLIFETTFRSKQKEKELRFIQSALIRRSYLMNFELVEPEIQIDSGEKRLEKIMNHLSFVFPEIEKINNKRISKNQSVEKYNKRFKRKFHFLNKYDLSIYTELGYFIINFYDKVDFKEIESISKKFSREKKGDVQIERVILVGKEFKFSTEKQNMEDMMISIKRKIHLDVIKEDENGYSIIWID